METEPTFVNVYEHKKNISIGRGRILWGTSTTDIGGKLHPPGWVLPGGSRIQDEPAAHAAALVLDYVIQANGG